MLLQMGPLFYLGPVIILVPSAVYMERICARVVGVSEVEQVRGSVRLSDTKQRVRKYCTKSLCVKLFILYFCLSPNYLLFPCKARRKEPRESDI